MTEERNPHAQAAGDALRKVDDFRARAITEGCLAVAWEMAQLRHGIARMVSIFTSSYEGEDISP